MLFWIKQGFGCQITRLPRRFRRLPLLIYCRILLLEMVFIPRTALCAVLAKRILNPQPISHRCMLFTSQWTARSAKEPFYSTENPAPYQSAVRTVNIAKDVMLYSADSQRFFKYMTWFCVMQFVFWLQMGFFPLLNFKQYFTSDGASKPRQLPSNLLIKHNDRWFVKYVMGQVSPDRPYYSLLMGIAYVVIGESSVLVLLANTVTLFNSFARIYYE